MKEPAFDKYGDEVTIISIFESREVDSDGTPKVKAVVRDLKENRFYVHPLESLRTRLGDK